MTPESQNATTTPKCRQMQTKYTHCNCPLKRLSVFNLEQTELT